MNTYSKSLLVAIAAVALTTSTVQANTALLKRAGLTSAQRTALTEAHELCTAGEPTAARDVLLEAGFTEDTLSQLRAARQANHATGNRPVETHRGHVFKTLSDEQHEALMVARQANDKETVAAILAEAGFTRPAEPRLTRSARWVE